MKRTILLNIICLFLLVIMYACETSNQLPNAYEISADEKNNIGEIKFATKWPTDKAFYRQEVTTGNGPFLYLGNSNGYVSRILMRFEMSNVPDSSVVRSAKLVLFAADILGNPGAGFPASVHKVSSSKTEWEENIKWSDFGDNFDRQSIGEVIEIASNIEDTTISEQDTTISTSKDIFKLDITSIINSDSTIDTNFTTQGLCILTDETIASLFLKKYYSAEAPFSSILPYLEVISIKDTTLDTTQIVPFHDTFIVRREQLEADSSDFLYTGRGISFHSLLKFDLQEIAVNATINRAQLKLIFNTERSLLGSDETPDIKLFPLENWPENPKDAEIDSFLTAGIISSINEDTIFVDITSLVQNSTALQEDNFGVLIRSLDEEYGLNRSVFYASKIDSALMPKLIINYTLPPKIGN